MGPENLLYASLFTDHVVAPDRFALAASIMFGHELKTFSGPANSVPVGIIPKLFNQDYQIQSLRIVVYGHSNVDYE